MTIVAQVEQRLAGAVALAIWPTRTTARSHSRCSPCAPRLLLIAAVSCALLAAPTDAHAESGAAAVGWGHNAHQELGAGYQSSSETTPVSVLGVTTIASMASAWEDSFALLGNGTVRSWGDNAFGQLGDDGVPSVAPVAVENLELGELTHVTAIAVGGDHALALLENGTVATWGDSQAGTRGNGESGVITEAQDAGTYVNRYVAATVPRLAHVKAIATAGDTDYALLESGEVKAWGGNDEGRLGIGVEPGQGKGGSPQPEMCKLESSQKTRETNEEAGAVACSKVPKTVRFPKLPAGVTVTSITGGTDAAYALLSNGEVMAWGNGAQGQLGNGKTASSDVPVPVDVSALASCSKPSPHCEAVAVSGGRGFAWALLSDGEVVGWGANSGGQLGSRSTEECRKGQNTCSLIPKRVIGANEIGPISAISAGRDGSGLALSAGKVYALGEGEPWGQLGVGGGMKDTRVPLPIEGLGRVDGIAAGQENDFATLAGGSGPPPLVSITPGVDSLIITWTVAAPEFQLRWKVVEEVEEAEEREGKGPEGATVRLREACSSGKPCSYTFKGLNPADAYRIRFTAVGQVPRHIVGTPLP